MALDQATLDEIQRQIGEAEKQIAVLEPEITKARLAGIDVADHTTRLADLKKLVGQLKLHYGKK